jgi:NitT/TauT family transport system substrate-binding protein
MGWTDGRAGGWGGAVAGLLGVVLMVACGAPAAPAAKPAAPAAGAGAAPASAPAAPAPAGASAAAPAAPAAPRELVKVRVGVPSIDADALPVTVPLEKGFFADEGLDVELIRLSANAAVAALTTGDRLRATAAGAPPTTGDVELGTVVGSSVIAASQGHPLKVIAVVHGAPMDAIVGRRDARTLSDLKGGKIAVSSPGAVMELLSRAVVQQTGLQPDDDVALVAMGQESNRYQALQLGQVDAAILGAPVMFEAEAQGFNILVNVGERVPIAVNGLVASETVLRERRDLVKRFLRAYIRGLEYTRDNPAETIRAVGEADEIADPAIAERTYERIMKAISFDAMAPESSVARYVQLSKDAGRITNEAAALAALDYSLTREVWQEMRR